MQPYSTIGASGIIVALLLKPVGVVLVPEDLTLQDWPEQAHRAGRVGEIYNIGGGQECVNLELARRIVQAVGSSERAIRLIKDRPAHDRRYALSSEKMAVELGWRPRVGLPEGLARTVAWYLLIPPGGSS
jgi:dTDP-D-glucose 4,6-dehydratase